MTSRLCAIPFLYRHLGITLQPSVFQRSGRRRPARHAAHRPAAAHGQRARVAVECTSSEALVVIEGDGQGIPSEMIGQVFEPFFRASRARAKEISGAGFGLTIAQEIVQRAGGSVTIEDGPVRGLLQIVKLPLDQMPRSGSA